MNRLCISYYSAKMYLEVFLLAYLAAASHADSTKIPQLILQVMGTRIRGGEDALPNQFPYQVTLQWGRKPDIEDVHFCGGTILTSQWIMTAAHCLVFLNKLPSNGHFVIKAGKHDLGKIESTEQVRDVEEYYIHKKYNRTQEVAPYDIGLIKLETPLELNELVAKAVLPTENSEPTGEVTLSGWGAVNADANNPVSPVILQTVTIPIVDRDTCNEAVRKIFAKKDINLDVDLVDEKNICTGPLSGGISACGGDSGGPLVGRNEDDELVVVGIVSWGMKPCGRKGAPAVFTRVSAFIDWIENIVENK